MSDVHRTSGEEAMIEGYGVSPAQGTVRLATGRDVMSIAALHCSAIGEGFLSTLGVPFLSRLYARIVASSRGFVLVADADRAGARQGSRIAGFVAGSSEVGRLYREFLWRDGVAVLAASGPRLLRSLPRVVETLRYGASAGGGGSARSSPASCSPEMELLAIAVDDGVRGRGVGIALVRAFVATARADASASARVIVSADNHRAIALYARSGFREDDRIEMHSGTQSLRMRLRLSPTKP